MAQAVADPVVREIWLSSEDTGAYGNCYHLPSFTVSAHLPPVADRMTFTNRMYTMDKHVCQRRSHDTAAGRDIGTNLAALLQRIVALLPRDGSTLLRVGMTNPVGHLASPVPHQRGQCAPWLLCARLHSFQGLGGNRQPMLRSLWMQPIAAASG